MFSARLLGALFVLTGGSALIIENAFEKLLSTVVGAGAPAGALVLAVYFGGLSLGGLLYAPLARRFRNKATLYGALEGLVALYAVALAAGFEPLQSVSSQVVIAAGEVPLLVFLARLLVTCAWMLPPTLAMGASYPAVAQALADLAGADPARRQALPRSLSRLYALNLLGATVAAFCAPYLLFPRFGVTGTLLGVALLNALAALAALAVGRALTLAPVAAPPDGATTHAAPEADTAADREPRRRSVRAFVAENPGLGRLLALAFASGFAVFALEVVWVHLIGATLGMSVYAFGLMLTWVLFGLFLGSTLVGLIPSRDGRAPDWALTVTALLAAAIVLVTQSFWDRVPIWLVDLGEGATTFEAGERVRFTIASLVVGLPALALGTLYPSLFRARTFPASEAGRASGLLGAGNALGSVLGALLAGFVLIPWCGSEALGRGLAVVIALLGAAAAPGRRLRGAAGLVAVAFLAVGLTLPTWNRLDLTAGTNVYFRRSFVHEGSTLRYFVEETAGGITTVVARKERGAERLTLLTNGKFQGSDGGETADQIGFGLVPSALTVGRAHALVIGLGTGQSAHVVAAAGFQAIDIAELSPGMVGAARTHFASVNGGILNDRRATVHLEDGRNFLLRTSTRYDLIGIELSSIWFAGVSNLYSREFYRLARDRLAPGGVLQQWVQLHHAAPDEVISVLATLRAEFRYVNLWLVRTQGVIVASDAPLHILPEALHSLQEARDMTPLLRLLKRRTGLTLENLGDRLVLGSEDVTRLYEGALGAGLPLNTDANRFLEFASPRHNLERAPHFRRILVALLEFVEPKEVQAARRKRFLKR